MAIPSRQIGWGTEENLLWQISKQLEQLTGVTSKIPGGGGGESYLKYVALLSHTGAGAPVATVLENTLGSAIVWSRAGVGYYNGANANFSDASKVFISLTGNYSNEGVGNIQTVTGEIYDDGSGNKLWFATSSNLNNLYDEWGTYISVEIRVYP
jgi:hypothetical protein